MMFGNFQNNRLYFYAVFLLLMIICKQSYAFFCSTILEDNLRDCKPLICNDNYQDKLEIQRIIVGKVGEKCKYREFYKKYVLYFECDFYEADLAQIIKTMPQESGPWVMNYENRCKPIFAKGIWKQENITQLKEKTIKDNIEKLYNENNLGHLRGRKLNFFSDKEEIKDKRDFLYIYDHGQYKNLNEINQNIDKNIDKFKFFVNKVIASKQQSSTLTDSSIVGKYIEIIKYLYFSIFTINSIMIFDNNYLLYINEKNLDLQHRDYQDFHIDIFDKEKISFTWNTKYFDDLYMLFREEFDYIDEVNLRHKKFPGIKIDLNNRVFHLEINSNQSFDPLQMRIFNGIPQYSITKSNLSIADIMSEDEEKSLSEEKKRQISDLIAKLNFDIYLADSHKYAIKNIFIRKIYDLAI